MLIIPVEKRIGFFVLRYSFITSKILLSPDGKTILVGVPNEKISIYSLPLHFKKILTGSHGGDSIPDIEIPRYIRLINKKKMTLNNY